MHMVEENQNNKGGVFMTNNQTKYDELVARIHKELYSRPKEISVQEAERLIGRILLCNDLLNLVEGSDDDNGGD